MRGQPDPRDACRASGARDTGVGGPPTCAPRAKAAIDRYGTREGGRQSETDARDVVLHATSWGADWRA
jgi:hypothetical protein